LVLLGYTAFNSFRITKIFIKEMNNTNDLTKAKYIEWLASLFGACGIALGLGVYFARVLSYYAPIFILLGIVLHAWGMYKIHQRNK
jgi:hypothetical protein